MPLPSTPPKDVPVFNCVVHVAPADSDGTIVARVANLPGLEARGKSEREALASAVAAFKATVSTKTAAGEAISFVDPPLPAAGETRRLIAVHL